jgi:heat shock protein HtpX
VTPIYLAIALLPGAVAWWTSRGLAKLKDDPALPELLFARRSRVTSVMWFAIIATSFADGDPVIHFGLFVLSVASPFAGGYPLARKLFGHTASFPGYLWLGLKWLIASLGPWILLLYAPDIVLYAEGPWRLATLLLVPLMLAWSWWYPQVWLALNEARPLSNPAVQARIDDIASRASVRAPSLFVFGSERMKVVNAVALRGTRPAVGLGNGLVELLEPDEVAAIYAHEIAHIEQIPERELRKKRLVSWALIVVSVVGFYLAAENLSSGTVSLLSLVWPLIALGSLLLQARKSKHYETDSDLRAAELTGDPELVARALVKVHVHGLVPRRWSVNFEKTSTHPSLARRVQALRGTSISAPLEAQPTVIQTARPSRVVAFDATRAYWFEGVPPGTQRELNALREQASGMRAASWNDLVELRIAADTEEDRALVATHKNGETWSVPITKADVAAVQKLLDTVDTRLHSGIAKTQKLNPRLILSVAAAITLFVSPGLLLLPLIIGIIRPSTAMLAGVAGLIGASAALRFTERMLPGYWSLVAPIVMLMVAAVMLTMARLRAKEEKRDGVQFTVIVLGLGALLMLLGASTEIGGGLSALARDPSIRGLAACLIGLATALLITGHRRARVGGVVSLAGGLAAVGLVIAMPVTSGNGFSTETAQLHEVRRVDFPVRTIQTIEASPGGRGILVDVVGDDDERGRGEWQLRYGDSLWTMPVIDAGFVDSTRLLSLWPQGDSLELRMERLDTTMIEWVMPLPRIENASLTTRPGNGSWAVVGDSPLGDSLVIVSGALGKDEAPILHLAPIDSMIPSVFLPGPAGRSVIGARMMIRPTGSSLVSALIFRRGFTSELWESSETGVRRLGKVEGLPMCGSSGSIAVRCMTINAGNVAFWRYTGDSVTKEGALAGGQFYRTDLGTSGLISMINFAGKEIQVGDPATGSLLRASVPVGDDGSITSVTAAPGGVWVAVRSAHKLSGVEYRLERTPYRRSPVSLSTFAFVPRELLRAQHRPSSK